MKPQRRNGLPPDFYPPDDNVFIAKQLKSDDEVYRQKDQLIPWPCVQLYRNLLIAATKTYFINPIYRTLVFLCMFIIFSLHDRIAKPFKEKTMNILQSSCSMCLTFIVICNMPFSFSLYLPNFYAVLEKDGMFELLSFVEKIMYFIPPLVLIVAIFWRNYFVKVKDE